MIADGVAFARTRQGDALPVIDVTHPRFALPDDPDLVRRLGDAFAAQERRRRLIPRFVLRRMMAAAAKQSRLVRAVFHAPTGYLDSISTYVMKLGADNLVPPFDTAMDRRVASSPHVPLMRLRMQQIAHSLAGALASDLAAAPRGAPLAVIDIGGGPALDAVNALIVLRRDHPGLLEDRRITVAVLDADGDGAFFGANALSALAAQGPLAGLDAAMTHRDYDWERPAVLQGMLAELVVAGAVIIATSEGALFEYGSDAAIVANLIALRAGGVRHVTGSVTNPHDLRRRMIDRTLFKLKPRGLEGIAPLFAAGGFRVVASEDAFLSTQVLLQAAP